MPAHKRAVFVRNARPAPADPPADNRAEAPADGKATAAPPPPKPKK